MKKLIAAMLLVSNIAFAGDLGIFSDGAKGAYRIYQNTEQVVVRSGSKADIYRSLASGENMYYRYSEDGSEILGYVEILDPSNVVLNEGGCAYFLTKKNSCE